VVSNLLAVSGRDAVDARITGGDIDYYNVTGKDVGTPRDVFGIRDVINRGPLMLDKAKAQELEYFDEAFAPIDSDDADLSFRAYRKGYLVGSYVINYASERMW